ISVEAVARARQSARAGGGAEDAPRARGRTPRARSVRRAAFVSAVVARSRGASLDLAERRWISQSVAGDRSVIARFCGASRDVSLSSLDFAERRGMYL